jgi:hypothetical protein
VISVKSIHSSMALQPFVGPWPLLQFRHFFYTDGRTTWTSDQPVARPLPKHRTTQHRINAHTDIHALSGIRTQDPTFERTKRVHVLHRASTVIGKESFREWNYNVKYSCYCNASWVK